MQKNIFFWRKYKNFFVWKIVFSGKLFHLENWLFFQITCESLLLVENCFFEASVRNFLSISLGKV